MKRAKRRAKDFMERTIVTPVRDHGWYQSYKIESRRPAVRHTDWTYVESPVRMLG